MGFRVDIQVQEVTLEPLKPIAAFERKRILKKENFRRLYEVGYKDNDSACDKDTTMPSGNLHSPSENLDVRSRDVVSCDCCPTVEFARLDWLIAAIASRSCFGGIRLG
jgi:hypothetical protein